MAYEQRSGDIAVFKETDKKNEKGPDWKGTMIVPEGVQPGDKLEVAFWAKGDRGTMLAGSAKPVRQQGQSFSGSRDGDVARRGGGGSDTQSERGGHRQAYDLNDDIPFARTAFDWEA